MYIYNLFTKIPLAVFITLVRSDLETVPLKYLSPDKKRYFHFIIFDYTLSTFDEALQTQWPHKTVRSFRF